MNARFAVGKWNFMVGARGGLLSVTIIIAIFCQKHGFANHGKKLPKNGTEGRVNRMAEYIEREALQAALLRKKAGVADRRFTEGWNDCLLRVKSMVHSAPAADVEPVRHGRWVLGKVEPGYFTPGGNRPWICSECGYLASWMLDKPKDNYCPNCGCRMDLEGGNT